MFNLSNFLGSLQIETASLLYEGDGRLFHPPIVSIRLCQRLGLPYVEPTFGVDGVALDAGLAADVNVERDDGKLAGPLSVAHVAEDRGREDVHAAEGQFVVAAFFVGRTGGQCLPGRLVHPSAQAVAAVGQQVAGCLAVVGQQGGVGSAFHVVAVEGGQVYVCQDVGVVDEEGLAVVQQGAGLQDASARVEQFAPFVADTDPHTEIIVRLQEVEYLFSEVMDIDDDVVESGLLQPQYHALQHGNTGYGDQGLGHVVGEWAQAGAQSGGKYHGFHVSCGL